MTFTTNSITLRNDATVSARIESAEQESLWQVTIYVDRPSGQPPIQEGDIDVQLFGEQGPFPAVSPPPESWVEAGGAAGTTANGTCTFTATSGTPTHVKISWRDEVADLDIRPAP